MLATCRAINRGGRAGDRRQRLGNRYTAHRSCSSAHHTAAAVQVLGTYALNSRSCRRNSCLTLPDCSYPHQCKHCSYAPDHSLDMQQDFRNWSSRARGLVSDVCLSTQLSFGVAVVHQESVLNSVHTYGSLSVSIARFYCCCSIC